MLDISVHRLAAEACGYKLVSRSEFEVSRDRPLGLVWRVDVIPGEFVLYDPDGDEYDWLLVGDDPAALVAETVRNLEMHGVA